MLGQTNHWIAVASANHVARGQSGGFMQVCHGKRAPLARIKPGDGVAYYSPCRNFGKVDGLQCLTAIGTVLPGESYAFDMGGGFIPFRRDVDWHTGHATSIRPLLDRLELTRGRPAWGQVFRFGLVKINADDFGLITDAMQTSHAGSAQALLI